MNPSRRNFLTILSHFDDNDDYLLKKATQRAIFFTENNANAFNFSSHRHLIC